MKSTRLMSLFLFSALLAAGAGPAGSFARQMSDMPFDLHFIDMMIMHYQEGIEMAELAQGKAQNVKIKSFATRAAVEQRQEIDELQRQRVLRYAGQPLMDHSMMKSMMEKMHPDMKMDMEDIRRKLRATNGSAFDRLFLDTMIHHQVMGADMARDAVTKAEHAEIRDFAEKTVTKLTAQITEMERLGTAPKAAPKTRSRAKSAPSKPKTHKH